MASISIAEGLAMARYESIVIRDDADMWRYAPPSLPVAMTQSDPSAFRSPGLDPLTLAALLLRGPPLSPLEALLRKISEGH